MQVAPHTANLHQTQSTKNRESVPMHLQAFKSAKTTSQKISTKYDQAGIAFGETNRNMDEMLLDREHQHEKHRKLMLENKLLQKKREQRYKMEVEQRRFDEKMQEYEKKRVLRQLHAVNLRGKSNLLSEQDIQPVSSPKNPKIMTRNQSQPQGKSTFKEEPVFKENPVVFQSHEAIEHLDPAVSKSINEFEKALKRFKKGKKVARPKDSPSDKSFADDAADDNKEKEAETKGKYSLNPQQSDAKVHFSTKFHKVAKASSDPSQALHPLGSKWANPNIKPIPHKPLRLKDESMEEFSFLGKDDVHSYRGLEERDPSFLQNDSQGEIKSNRAKPKSKINFGGDLPIVGTSPSNYISSVQKKKPSELFLSPPIIRKDAHTTKASQIHYQPSLVKSQPLRALSKPSDYEYRSQLAVKVPFDEEGLRELNRQEKEIQEFIMRLHEERRKEFSRVEHKYDPEHSNLNNLRLHLAESNSIVFEHTKPKNVESGVLPNIRTKDPLKVQGTQSYGQLHTKKVNFSEGRSTIQHTKDITHMGKKLTESNILNSPESRFSSSQSPVLKSHVVPYDSKNVTRKSEFQAKLKSTFQVQPEIAEKSAVFEKSHQSSMIMGGEAKLPEIRQTEVQEIKVSHYNVPIEDSPFNPSYDGFQRPPVRLRKHAQPLGSKVESQVLSGSEKQSPETGKNKKKYHVEPIQRPPEELENHMKEVKIFNSSTKNAGSVESLPRVSKTDGTTTDTERFLENKEGLLSKRTTHMREIEVTDEHDRNFERHRIFQPLPQRDNILSDLDKGTIKIHTNINLHELMNS